MKYEVRRAKYKVALLFFIGTEPTFPLQRAKNTLLGYFLSMDARARLLAVHHAEHMQKDNHVKPLEDRTLVFARNVRTFVAKIPYSRLTVEDCKQLLRSSGSVGANYLEAQSALRRPDFFYRIRISRKESNESKFWLRLLEGNIPKELEMKRQSLFDE